MKETLCSNALFGIVLCAAAWQAGVWAVSYTHLKGG